MKIYNSNVEIPVTSNARKPTPFYVPPWTISRSPRVGPLGEWSPPRSIRIVGGYVLAASFTGNPMVGVAVVKNNIFDKNMVVGSCLMSGANTLELTISIANPILGTTLVTPYDNIQVIVMGVSSGSAYSGVTIQLLAEEVV